MHDARGLIDWDLLGLASSMLLGTAGTMMLGGYYVAPHAPGAALGCIVASMILFAAVWAGLDESGDPSEGPPE